MKTPLKNSPLRQAGQSLDEKFNEFLDEKIFIFILLILIVIVFIGLEWIRFYWSMPPRPIPMTVTGIIFIFFCIYRIKINTKIAKSIKQGRDGERIVGQQLEELRAHGCLIFHDVIGDNFNIDHVVIAPQGIFTIETKTWSKKNPMEEIRFDGIDLIVNGYSPERNAIIQSFSEAKWLKQILKESTDKDFSVKPVIVFPGWFIDPVSSNKAQEKGIWLLNPKALPKYIQNLPVIINNEDLHLADFHLKRYLQSLNNK